MNRPRRPLFVLLCLLLSTVWLLPGCRLDPPPTEPTPSPTIAVTVTPPPTVTPLPTATPEVNHSLAYSVRWDEAVGQEGTAADTHGNVLIIGGDVTGPAATGGRATWTVETEPGQVSSLELVLETNGHLYWGKGIHATQPGGQVELYVNGKLVHVIQCDVLGQNQDYWPQNAYMGSSGYYTGRIDVADLEIAGPQLQITVVAAPYTVLDVNRVRVVVQLAEE